MSETQNPWTVLSAREIYENPWIQLTEYQVINPSGGRGIYGQVHFRNLAVGILPIDAAGNTWLVGQYRFTLNAFSWEIPEGGGGPGDDPLDSAKRELLEETGLRARTWVPLLTMHLSNSVSDEKAQVWLAMDLEAGQPQPEETEKLIIRKLPFAEAFAMVMQGEITDSISVAAILKLNWMQHQGLISILP